MVDIVAKHLLDVGTEASIVHKTVANSVLAQQLSDFTLLELEVQSSQAGSELNSKSQF